MDVDVASTELVSEWQNSGRSDGVERETAEAERDRKDAEKAAAIKERQIRLGHIPNLEEEEESPEKPPAEPTPKP